MSALWTRDTAREVLIKRLGEGQWSLLLDELEACMRPVPPQAVDRDALTDLRRATQALALELPASVWDDYTARLDRVLALLRPDER